MTHALFEDVHSPVMEGLRPGKDGTARSQPRTFPSLRPLPLDEGCAQTLVYVPLPPSDFIKTCETSLEDSALTVELRRLDPKPCQVAGRGDRDTPASFNAVQRELAIISQTEMRIMLRPRGCSSSSLPPRFFDVLIRPHNSKSSSTVCPTSSTQDALISPAPEVEQLSEVLAVTLATHCGVTPSSAHTYPVAEQVFRCVYQRLPMSLCPWLALGLTLRADDSNTARGKAAAAASGATLRWCWVMRGAACWRTLWQYWTTKMTSTDAPSLVTEPVSPRYSADNGDYCGIAPPSVNPIESQRRDRSYASREKSACSAMGNAQSEDPIPDPNAALRVRLERRLLFAQAAFSEEEEVRVADPSDSICHCLLRWSSLALLVETLSMAARNAAASSSPPSRPLQEEEALADYLIECFSFLMSHVSVDGVEDVEEQLRDAFMTERAEWKRESLVDAYQPLHRYLTGFACWLTWRLLTCIAASLPTKLAAVEQGIVEDSREETSSPSHRLVDVHALFGSLPSAQHPAQDEGRQSSSIPQNAEENGAWVPHLARLLDRLWGVIFPHAAASTALMRAADFLSRTPANEPALRIYLVRSYSSSLDDSAVQSHLPISPTVRATGEPSSVFSVLALALPSVTGLLVWAAVEFASVFTGSYRRWTLARRYGTSSSVSRSESRPRYWVEEPAVSPLLGDLVEPAIPCLLTEAGEEELCNSSNHRHHTNMSLAEGELALSSLYAMNKPESVGLLGRCLLLGLWMQLRLIDVDYAFPPRSTSCTCEESANRGILYYSSSRNVLLVRDWRTVTQLYHVLRCTSAVQSVMEGAARVTQSFLRARCSSAAQVRLQEKREREKTHWWRSVLSGHRQEAEQKLVEAMRHADRCESQVTMQRVCASSGSNDGGWHREGRSDDAGEKEDSTKSGSCVLLHWTSYPETFPDEDGTPPFLLWSPPQVVEDTACTSAPTRTVSPVEHRGDALSADWSLSEGSLISTFSSSATVEDATSLLAVCLQELYSTEMEERNLLESVESAAAVLRLCQFERLWRRWQEERERHARVCLMRKRMIKWCQWRKKNVSAFLCDTPPSAPSGGGDKPSVQLFEGCLLRLHEDEHVPPVHLEAITPEDSSARWLTDVQRQLMDREARERWQVRQAEMDARRNAGQQCGLSHSLCALSEEEAYHRACRLQLAAVQQEEWQQRWGLILLPECVLRDVLRSVFQNLSAEPSPDGRGRMIACQSSSPVTSPPRRAAVVKRQSTPSPSPRAASLMAAAAAHRAFLLDSPDGEAERRMTSERSLAETRVDTLKEQQQPEEERHRSSSATRSRCTRGTEGDRDGAVLESRPPTPMPTPAVNTIVFTATQRTHPRIVTSPPSAPPRKTNSGTVSSRSAVSAEVIASLPLDTHLAVPVVAISLIEDIAEEAPTPAPPLREHRSNTPPTSKTTVTTSQKKTAIIASPLKSSVATVAVVPLLSPPKCWYVSSDQAVKPRTVHLHGGGAAPEVHKTIITEAPATASNAAARPNMLVKAGFIAARPHSQRRDAATHRRSHAVEAAVRLAQESDPHLYINSRTTPCSSSTAASASSAKGGGAPDTDHKRVRHIVLRSTCVDRPPPPPVAVVVHRRVLSNEPRQRRSSMVTWADDVLEY